MILLFMLPVICASAPLYAMDWDHPAILEKNNAPIKHKTDSLWLHKFKLNYNPHDTVYIDTQNEQHIVKVFSTKGYCDYLAIKWPERRVDYIRFKINPGANVGPDINLYDNAEMAFYRMYNFPEGFNYLMSRKLPSKVVALFVNPLFAPVQNNRLV